MALAWSGLGAGGFLLGSVSIVVATILFLWGRGRPPSLVLGFHFVFLAIAVLVPSASILVAWPLPPLWITSTWLATLLWQGTLLAFPVVYPYWSWSRRRVWRFVWACLPALAILAAGLLVGGLFFTSDGGPTFSLIRVTWWMNNVVLLVGLLVFVRRWITSRPGASRTEVLYVLLAYAFYALNHVFLDLSHLTERAPSLGLPVPVVNLYLDVIILALLATLALVSLTRGRRPDGDAAMRRLPLLLLILLPVPAMQMAYPGIMALFGFDGTGYEAMFFHLFLDGLPSALLFYGVMRGHVFDIDLKIKWTFQRGTAAAALAAVFFLIKEGLEALLPLEGIVAGIAGAAAITLLALPVWRAASRLVDRVMPDVQDTPDYLARRRHEVYRAAALSALSDGRLTENERSVLRTLQAEFGLSGRDVQRIEHELGITRRGVT